MKFEQLLQTVGRFDDMRRRTPHALLSRETPIQRTIEPDLYDISQNQTIYIIPETRIVSDFIPEFKVSDDRIIITYRSDLYREQEDINDFTARRKRDYLRGEETALEIRNQNDLAILTGEALSEWCLEKYGVTIPNGSSAPHSLATHFGLTQTRGPRFGSYLERRTAEHHGNGRICRSSP